MKENADDNLQKKKKQTRKSNIFLGITQTTTHARNICGVQINA